MHRTSKSTYTLLVVGFVLGGCGGGGSSDKSNGNTSDGGHTSHAGNGGTMELDGGTDGSTSGTTGSGGTMGLDGGTDGSTSGTTGSGGSHADNDAGTSIVQQPHKILYWGGYGAGNTIAADVIDMPSGKKRSLDLQKLTDFGIAMPTRDAKLLVMTTSGHAGSDGGTPVDPQMMAVNTATSEITQLVKGKGSIGYFDTLGLSADGKLFATVLEDDNGINLVVGDLAGQQQPAVIAMGMTGQFLGHPTFSPKGLLAMIVEDTSASTQAVMVLKQTGATWSTSMLPTPGTYGAAAVWGPDETLYYFTPDQTAGLHLLARDTTADTESEIKGADALLATATSVRDLAVSADAKHLVFAADGETSDRRDAYMLSLADGNVRQLTHFGTESPQGEVHDVYFSPDSKWIVMSVKWALPSGQSGVSGSLVVTDLAGKVRTRLDADPTDYHVEAQSMCFSPDGTQLYFSADARTNGDLELYGVDLNHPSQDWSMPLQAVPAMGDVEGVIAYP